jgi:gas vesicle protein
MTNLETIGTYKLLKDKLGDEAAEAILKYIDVATKTNVATKEDLLASRAESKQNLGDVRDELKNDTAQLREELYNVRDELKGDIAKLRDELYKVRDELKGDIAKLRDELYKVRDDLKDEMFRIKIILYVLIAITLITNPKIIELLGKALGIFK